MDNEMEKNGRGPKASILGEGPLFQETWKKLARSQDQCYDTIETKECLFLIGIPSADKIRNIKCLFLTEIPDADNISNPCMDVKIYLIREVMIYIYIALGFISHLAPFRI